ncbi:MAG: hypothetical protein RLZZ196_1749, partial [Bacteroidota bacterium]
MKYCLHLFITVTSTLILNIVNAQSTKIKAHDAADYNEKAR